MGPECPGAVEELESEDYAPLPSPDEIAYRHKARQVTVIVEADIVGCSGNMVLPDIATDKELSESNLHLDGGARVEVRDEAPEEW